MGLSAKIIDNDRMSKSKTFCLAITQSGQIAGRIYLSSILELKTLFIKQSIIIRHKSALRCRKKADLYDMEGFPPHSYEDIGSTK